MSNEITYSVVQDYLKTLVPPRSSEMQAMEIHAKEAGFPIIGAPAGYLCYQIARITGAKHVFELGSGYGYSTAWFAKAVTENGGGAVRRTSRAGRDSIDHAPGSHDDLINAVAGVMKVVAEPLRVL